MDRKSFLSEIIVTAVEGGIDYWADLRRYQWSNGSDGHLDHASVEVKPVEVRPADKVPEWVVVDHALIENGLAALRTGTIRINRDMLGDILASDVTNDSGEIDSDAADVIVQVSMFADIVYG